MVGRHRTVAADATNQSLKQSTEFVSNHDSTGSPVVLLRKAGDGRPEAGVNTNPVLRLASGLTPPAFA